MGKKITQLTSLVINGLTSEDVIPIVDVSDKTDSSSGTTKKVSTDAFVFYNEVFYINDFISSYTGDEGKPILTGNLGYIDTGLMDLTYITNQFDDYYTKLEFIDTFTGTGGQPIKTNTAGLIPANLVDIATFNYVDKFTPTGGDEYPDTTGYPAGNGYTWLVENVDAAGYTFAGGELVGETVYNDAFMLEAVDGWVLMQNIPTGTPAVWGGITGILSDQADLQGELDLKADDSDLTAHTTNTSNPHSVDKTDVDLGNVENIKSNLTAVRAPTVSDDITEGYVIGSSWVYGGGGKSWVCTDNTDGIAIWVEQTVQGSGSASWGTIGGNIEDQTDLQTELGTLESSITPNTTHRTGAGNGASAHVSAQDRLDWDAAHNVEHSHSNKSTLDTYDQTNTDLAGAVTHSKIVAGNPHAIDGADVGLGNVDNTSDLAKPISTATQSALDDKASSTALTNHTTNTANPHDVNKTDVDLGNVDNTTDLNKPISTATQSALDDKYDKVDFIDTFTGISGEPVKTGTNGMIPSALVDIRTTQFVDNFTPTGPTEYPDTTGYPSGNGYTWIIVGVDEGAGYTFAAGDLNGQTIYNDAWLIWGEGDLWMTSNNHSGGSTSTAWGTISGTLSEQTDLNNALGDKASASALSSHVANEANPHAVVKADVDLANVDNTSDLAKPISTATQTALDAKANASALTTHINDGTNPHSVTKEQVGLGSVDNTSDVNKPISGATQTALDAKADTTALNSHVTNLDNPHQVNATDVGLGSADNTSDADKPISSATQSALNLKADESDVALTTGSPIALTTMWSGTQAQYDGLTPDANTLYFIVG